MVCIWPQVTRESLYNVLRNINQALKLLSLVCRIYLLTVLLYFYCIDSCFLYCWAEVMLSFTFLTPLVLQIVWINAIFPINLCSMLPLLKIAISSSAVEKFCLMGVEYFQH